MALVRKIFTYIPTIGRHESAELLFMLVGHTKFSPDRFLGLFKKASRRATVCTIFEIPRIVSISTTNGQHLPQLIRDVDGTVQVQFYQWSAHLGQFFYIPTYLLHLLCDSVAHWLCKCTPTLWVRRNSS